MMRKRRPDPLTTTYAGGFQDIVRTLHRYDKAMNSVSVRFCVKFFGLRGFLLSWPSSFYEVLRGGYVYQFELYIAIRPTSFRMQSYTLFFRTLTRVPATLPRAFSSNIVIVATSLAHTQWSSSAINPNLNPNPSRCWPSDR